MATSISLPKSGLKTVLIESLYNEIVSNTNNYYYFIGKPQEWGNGETAIESPTLAITSDSDTRRDMVFAKKITGADVSFTIPRINWTSGLVYDIYDDRVGDFVELKASAATAGTNYLIFENALNTSIDSTTVESIMQKFGEGWKVIGFDSDAVTNANNDLDSTNDLSSDNPIPADTFVESASYNALTGAITVILKDSVLTRNISTAEATGNNTIRFQCLAYSGAASLKESSENRTGPYVYTPDRHVYKCLFNNRGAESTVMPYSTSHELITTSDGYIWKYMYTIPNALFNKFVTTYDIPVTTAVRAPYYSGGALTSATVQYYGSGYSYSNSPSITVKGDGYLADNPYKIVTFVVDDPGYGYVTPPTIVVDPPFATTTWKANTEYATGTKLSVRGTDIYEVVAPGISSTVYPTHTSNEPLTNGTTLLKFVGRQAVVQVGSNQKFRINAITSGNTIEYTSAGASLTAGQQIQFTDAYTPMQVVPTQMIMNAGSDNYIIATGHPFIANQGISFDYSCSIPYTVASTDVNTSTGIISISNHKLTTGCKVVYNTNGGLAIQGLLNGSSYYVIVDTTSTIKLADTLAHAQAGTAITITTTGNSAQTFTYTPIAAGVTYYVKTVVAHGAAFTISATPGGDTIPLIARKFVTNARAAVAIIPNTIYWVTNATSSTFRISATPSGADIVLAPNSLNFQPSSINTTSDLLTYTPTTIYHIPTSNVNLTTNVITIGNHRLTTGSKVTYYSSGGGVSSTAISPLSNGGVYYAIVISSTTIRLATSSTNAYAGNAIDLLSTTGNDYQYLSYTGAGNHGLAVDTQVKYYKNTVSGTAAAIASNQIADGSTFYVVDAGGNWTSSTFKLSTSQDGTPVDFTSNAYTTTYTIDPSNVSTLNSTFVITNHGFTTGTEVTYTPNGTAMVSAGTYYIIVVSSSALRLATSALNAVNNISVTLLTTGNVAQTIKRVGIAGNAAQQFSWYGWNRYGIQVLDVACAGTRGQFVCTNSSLSVGKTLIITGALTGTGTIGGYTTGAMYKVVSVIGSSPNVTGFTLQTASGGMLITTPGTMNGLTFTSNTSAGSIGAYSQTGLSGTEVFSTSQASSVTSIDSGNIINTPGGNQLSANQPVWFGADYNITYPVPTTDVVTAESPVTFTHTSGGSEVDYIDTGLAITKQSNQSIYNPLSSVPWATQSGSDPTLYTGPDGTLWNIDGWSDLSNVATRTYATFPTVMTAYLNYYVANVNANWSGSGWGQLTVYPDFVMKDTINNKYYKIKFSAWGSGSFTYTRTLLSNTGTVVNGNSIKVTSHGITTGDALVYNTPSTPIEVLHTFLTTAVDLTAKTIDITNHGFITGDSTTYNAHSGSAMVTEGTYYVIVVNADRIQLASSLANAIAGTPVSFITTGNNNQTLSGTITNGYTYYAIADSVDYFRVATSYARALAGTALDITSQGNSSQTFTFSNIDAEAVYFVSPNSLTNTTFKIRTSTSGSDKVLIPSTLINPYTSTVNTAAAYNSTIRTANTLQAGQIVKFSDSAGSIAANKLYYVSGFGLSSTQFGITEMDGTAVSITGPYKFLTNVTVCSGVAELYSRHMLAYVTLTNPGRGYSPNSPPNVYISTDPTDTGTGAKAVASVTSEGYLNRIVLSDRGSDYSAAVAVSIDNPPQLVASFAATAVDTTLNTITLPNAPNSITGCGFYTGARVKYYSSSPISGLVANATYYVVATGSNTIKLTYSFYNAMKNINTIALTSVTTDTTHEIRFDVEGAQAFADTYIGYGYSSSPLVRVADPYDVDEVDVTFATGLGGVSSQHVTNEDIVLVPNASAYGQNTFFKVAPTIFEVAPGDVSTTSSTITIANHGLTTGVPLTYTSGGGTQLSVVGGLTNDSGKTFILVNNTNINTTTGVITTPSNHGLTTGTPVYYTISSGVGLPELEVKMTYYVVVTAVNKFKLALSAADALATTPITISLSVLDNGAQVFAHTTSYYAIVVDTSTIQLANSMANALAETPVPAVITGTGNGAQYFAVLYPQLSAAPTFTSGSGRSGTATLQAVGRTASVRAVAEKTRAVLLPLIDAGGVVGVIVQEPGIGYTSADLNAIGTTASDPAIITPNLSIGDVETRQANTELLAVPGTIDSIVVLHKGGNYDPTNVQVKITGDGTGATAVANIDGNQVVSIDIINHGTGYSRATIEIIGVPLTGPTLEKAFARAIISPRRGHGNNAVAELYATDVTLTTTFGTEKNQGFYIGYESSTANSLHNDYRQFGILKNPQVIGSTLRYNKPLASPCYAVNIKFAAGIVYNPTHKDEGDIPLDSVLIEKDETKPAYRYVIVDSSAITSGARLLLSAVDNAAPYVGQTLKTSDKANIGTITSVTSPDIDKYSGEIMFIDNRKSFQTSADQTVAVKTTIRL